MADLIDIQGVGEGQAELLGAVGVEKLSSLSQSDPGSLLEEMERANVRLELVEQVPGLDELVSWIKASRELEEQEAPLMVTRLEEVVELVPIEVLMALPVKKESIVKNGIEVGDVPVMEEFLEEKDLYVEQVRSVDAASQSTIAIREIVPTASAKSTGNHRGEEKEKGPRERVIVKPLKRNSGFDIRKTATPQLNEGKKMHSSTYIRGVLHPQSGRVKFGAFLSVITLILFPLTFVAGGLVVAFRDIEEAKWLLVFPVAFVVFAVLYFLFARPMKCRVCGQPIFRSMSCRRNPKAHYIPLMGYILPTSFHLLFLHWFRCIYCGTSVRLKE